MKNRILTILSAILLMLPVLASAQSAESFTDVSANNKNTRAIGWLKTNGVIAGYEDGSFKPENSINRAELMKILVEGMGMTPDADTYKNCFSDVKEDWYAKYVCYAQSQGWVEGYPDGTFKPAQNVNDAEALKMILESQGVSEPAGYSTFYYQQVSNKEWYYPYILTAEKLNVGGPYQLGMALPRSEVAEVIFRTLAIKLLDVNSFDMAAAEEMMSTTLPRDVVDQSKGWLEGSLSYPSHQLPDDLTVCARNLDTDEQICTTDRLENAKYTYGFGYKMEVTPGTYEVFAFTEMVDGTLTGYYTEYARCGMTIACEQDHTVIMVEIGPGETVEFVDPADWYGEPVFG
ncbi:MAG: S-layer homology domain-containing protein [Candidatus Altimarinota bacterium]